MVDALNTKKALMALGYYQIPEYGLTAFPDTHTFDCIKAFQRDHKLRVDGIMKPRRETANALGEQILLAGGPDETGDLVHVDGYTQDREGAPTNVVSHTRSAPRSGKNGNFYSKGPSDYYRSDGKIADGRNPPFMKPPIDGGKMRGNEAGHFDARRKNDEGYYYQHGAIDILAEPGTPVVSSIDGTVTRVGQTTDDVDLNYQLHYVEVTSPEGYVARHLYAAPTVEEGDQVVAGETNIGTVQDIGPVYGDNMPNHMHLEVYDSKTPAKNGRTGIKGFKKVDPALYMMSGERLVHE